MPSIEVDGFGTINVQEGTRLVRALEDNGVDLLHRCGGFARCTTCRVLFSAGEPDRITVAEHDKLEEKGELGKVRLSCQILCEADMSLHVINRFSESGLSDPGPQPQEVITPDPVWMDAVRSA